MMQFVRVERVAVDIIGEAVELETMMADYVTKGEQVQHEEEGTEN